MGQGPRSPLWTTALWSKGKEVTVTESETDSSRNFHLHVWYQGDPVQTPSPKSQKAEVGAPEETRVGSARYPPAPLGIPGRGHPDDGGQLGACSDQVQAQASPAVPGRQGRCCWTQYGSLRTPYGGSPGRGAGKRQDTAPHPLHPPPSTAGSFLGGSWWMGWPASQVPGSCPCL